MGLRWFVNIVRYQSMLITILHSSGYFVKFLTEITYSRLKITLIIAHYTTVIIIISKQYNVKCQTILTIHYYYSKIDITEI